MQILFKLILSLLCGIALSFTQAPHDLWPLIFPCFGLLYFMYERLQNKRQVFLLSFFFAIGYFIAGLNWIGNALRVEGNEFLWVWPLAVIALPTLLALFTALYLTINFILFKNTITIKFIGFCLFLSFSEWVRGNAFTGFPWSLYGYGIAGLPEISQSLSLIGPYGLTFMTIFWGSMIGFLCYRPILSPQKFLLLLTTILTFGGLYVYGQDRLKIKTAFNEDVVIHVVQPNIAQAEKWKTENIGDNFNQHIALLQTPLDQTKQNVVIWPETAVPPVLINNQAVNERINFMLGANGTLLAGALSSRLDPETQKPDYRNALMSWSQSGNAKRLYSKSHLVPFGEYIPFQKYIPIGPVTQFIGFQRGAGATSIKLGNLPSFTPQICYEIIFPHQIVNKKQARPDYILTVTNDGWYGDSAGPRQHYQQSRFRAIEQGLPVVRSANTGISGIIDAYGRNIKMLPLLEEGATENALPIKIAPTLYSQFGDQIYLIFSLILLILCLFIARRSFS